MTEEVKTLADLDAELPVQRVTFTPGVREIGLRNMADRARGMAAQLATSTKVGPTAEAAAWWALADALDAAAGRDAATYGEAIHVTISMREDAA
ncbi:hypothetical protein [Sorangium sp. So ce388]|uniref:hypothetical protein n=1 Tax=Sorangium sp. So ce388 TaxID=3133309 RepID=UPI003F5C85E0